MCDLQFNDVKYCLEHYYNARVIESNNQCDVIKHLGETVSAG